MAYGKMACVVDCGVLCGGSDGRAGGICGACSSIVAGCGGFRESQSGQLGFTAVILVWTVVLCGW